ncbi:hypothetical protein [Petroclostridium sp. X23]|uniref:hypothetical protein n=1 Tax=Petroclostridium sp. X23 TaxID=3045146 RepID=UPI0024AD4F06|nr:hypothetical protein [Petroclostridium sp. X23]WHH59283.1 hypothetical protein QKW49_00495 [Petroclostridium sp. X23]
MENKPSLKSNTNLTGIISMSMPIVLISLILNWFFRITPYQKLEGMPLLLAPLVSAVGFILGLLSLKKRDSRLAKCSLVMNVMLFILPFVYWVMGTLLFGV